MRRSRPRFMRSISNVVATCVAAGCLAVALAGCGASPMTDRNTADSTTGSAAVTRTTSDGGGLLAQILATHSVREKPGDASEGYSPLHSSRGPHRLPETPWPWSPAEEDAIIAVAITAHETRRP